MKLAAREDLKEPAISFLLDLDDPSFRAFFSGSPVKRIGRDRFIRNVLIAAGNSGDRGLIDPCRRLSQDGSAIVRAMAVWALSRLMRAGEFSAFAAERPDEADEDVRAEWRLAGRL
jgi:epoxyqueuosine reductase